MNVQSPLSSHRILVVEDDPDLCHLIERLAAQAHLPIEIVFASSVHEAVHWIDEPGEFDLVLADFMLADSRSGYELRDFCRSRIPSTTFAMMSSMPLDAPGLERDRFLRKPFSPSECTAFLSAQLSL